MQSRFTTGVNGFLCRTESIQWRTNISWRRRFYWPGIVSILHDEDKANHWPVSVNKQTANFLGGSIQRFIFSISIRETRCRHCGYQFTRGRAALHDERNVCRLNPERKERQSVLCSYCWKQFATRYSAQVHERIVCRQNPDCKHNEVQCWYCFAWSTLGNRLHERERNFCELNPYRKPEEAQCLGRIFWHSVSAALLSCSSLYPFLPSN